MLLTPVVFEFKAPEPNAVFDDIAPAPLPTRTPDRVASVVEEIAPVTASAPEFTAASVEVPDADSVVNAPAAGVLAPTVPFILIEAVPVKFVTIPLLGIPRAGVTKVGLVANTKEPVPVSPVTADAKLAEDGVVKKVATPVPKPATPVEIGNPVALVNTPDEGVPRAGVTKVGLVFKTLLPVPVELVTPVPPCATVTVAACFTSLPVVPLKATKPSAVAEAGPTTSPADPSAEASSFTVPAAFLK
jgi:hypothetical protein